MHPPGSSPAPSALPGLFYFFKEKKKNNQINRHLQHLLKVCSVFTPGAAPHLQTQPLASDPTEPSRMTNKRCKAEGFVVFFKVCLEQWKNVLLSCGGEKAAG